MRRLFKYLAVPLMLLMTFAAKAQGEGNNVEMADAMRSSGKIYVVVVSLLLILLGLLVYLFITDRKISKLEDQIRDHQ